MNRKRILVCVLILLIICNFYNLASADKSEIYFFGKEPTADWVEKNLGKEFTYIIINALKIEEKLAILYYKGKGDDHQAYLSIFENGKENLLWKYDDVSSLSKVVLLSGYIDKNEIPDFIFCYTIVKEGGLGAGKGGELEVWKRQLILFFDGKETQKIEIPLGHADVICNDLENICQSKKGKAASRRESSVIVFPADEYGKTSVNIFSYFSEFNTLLEEASNTKYESVRYRIKGSDISKEKIDDYSIVTILGYGQGICFN